MGTIREAARAAYEVEERRSQIEAEKQFLCFADAFSTVLRNALGMEIPAGKMQRRTSDPPMPFYVEDDIRFEPIPIYEGNTLSGVLADGVSAMLMCPGCHADLWGGAVYGLADLGDRLREAEARQKQFHSGCVTR